MATKHSSDNKNILVLGGAGFIGSHLCEDLLKKGNNVICIDNFSSSDVENIKMFLEYPNFTFIRHDITEPIDFDIFPELKKFRVEVYGFAEIYNLACPTSPKDHTKLPVPTARANSIGVINSLDLARKYKAKYLLASTASVYGEPPQDNSLVKEDYYGLVDYLSPRACYNEGKRFAETLVVTYRDFYQLDTRIARIFSTYGPRMLEHSGRRIPDYIQEALNDKEVVVAADPNMMSSYCYVKDMVDGLVKLMESDIKDPINLGDEKAYILNDIAQKIIELTGSKANLRNRDNFAHALKPAIPDISKAKTELNWFPLVPLEKGLKETIEYLRSRSQQYQPYLQPEDESTKEK